MDSRQSEDKAQPSSSDLPPDNLPFFIVGIGASAGGIHALTEFFSRMPADSGMAFVIVLHLSPKYESEAAAILQAKTPLRVVQVNETVPIEKNCIYIISPANDLFMNGGCLQIVPAVRPKGRHTAIDLFLRSLAEAHQSRAIGIILSGADSDGAVGIARIKEKGGVAIAQSPDEAEFDGMPRSAIATGMIDMVLPVAQMPGKLLALVANASSIRLPLEGADDAGMAGATVAEAQREAQEKALLDVLSLLRLRTGHDFKDYKRGTILRRIERRLQVTGLSTVAQYRDFLEQHPDETGLLLQDMLISVTNFFRDREAFGALEREVIPALFDHADAREQIRAWSVACATGEEAYSIAILLAEQDALRSRSRSIQVLASDIDEKAISIARRGTYAESIAADVSAARLKRWFIHLEKHYGIKNEIRENMLFALHNVLHDPPFSKLHLISCRNFLIYLRRETQVRVFEILHYALRPNGYLFLGASESTDAVPDLFVPVNKKYRIYQALPIKAGTRQVTAPLFSVGENLLPTKMAGAHAEHPKPPSPDMHRRVMEDYGMPAILVNQDGNLLYLTKPASRFLQWPSGELSHNILEMLQPELQLELSPALSQASQSRQNVETRPVPVEHDGKRGTVRILVRPVRDPAEGEGLILLVFDEKEDAGGGDTISQDSKDSAIISRYDNELKYAKEQLRSLAEQYSTALQDAKAANEELQAVNEELGSTMEELETSREELQSTNEELLSVNLDLESKVEATAKASDDLQNFLAASEIATIFIDRQQHVQRYTKPAATIFNLIATDVGRSLFDITHRLHYQELAQDVAHLFETLQPIEREVQSQDGKWYLARLLPYRTSENYIEGLVLTFIDISRRRDAEESVRLNAERMRLISASTRDYAIITLDVAGAITSWNSGAENIFGYTAQEMLGHSVDVLLTAEDRQAHVFQDELRRAKQKGRAEDKRWYARKDGTRALCSGVTAPLVDETLRGYIKIARDLTRFIKEKEEHQAALSSEKAERTRAEEAARLRDEFFAVLSHELKQPLNLIQLSAEMLSLLPEAAKSPTIARNTATIKRMVESQAKIIDDLMDLSRLHTGKLTLKRSRVNLSETVSQVVGLMMKESEQKGIKLSLEHAAEALIIHGDMVRIEQVILNLLNNALKFTRTGGEVHVRLSRTDAEACMEVSDNGKGIAPEFLPFIFDMFRQGDTGTTRQYGGLGIGLALVKELVDSHGGHVEAHSDGLGKGARFRVYLPLSVSLHAALPSVDNHRKRLAGKHMLIVDDSAEMLELLDDMLTREGAQVTTATSGAEALRRVEQHEGAYQLIISDIGMPDMDGYALLAELRKREATAKTPAIALSGFTRPKDVEQALKAGFETHVHKPVSIERLVSLARSISN
jgi:two-component system CheB/CheR fusion protein